MTDLLREYDQLELNINSLNLQTQVLGVGWIYSFERQKFLEWTCRWGVEEQQKESKVNCIGKKL